MLEHQMTLWPSVIIMFVSSFLLGYFVNETIALRKNITINQHKLYMSLFMAFQMALIELLMHYYYTGTTNVYLLIVLILGIIIIGYKLYTLNFLDNKQFLLAMIEHHENAIAMVNANDKYYGSKSSLLQQLKNNIKSSQNGEIQLMYQLLQKK